MVCMKEEKKRKKKRRSSPFFIGKEKNLFIENLSILLASGIDIVDALDGIGEDVKSPSLKKIIDRLKIDLEEGMSLWKALSETRLLPEYTISLIQIGEESGRLSENLVIISVQQEKDREFKSRLRSAMMYPIFVLVLVVVIGIGISWFILPKLAGVFDQLDLTLPTITKVVIFIGQFFEMYGIRAVISLIMALVGIVYLLFYFKYTKRIGQWMILHTPGVGKLVMQVELTRFGYILGTLLEAGIPITSALQSLANATPLRPYQKLYTHLIKEVEEGNSIKKSLRSFKHVKKIFPLPMQQLVFSGEKSGKLAGTLLTVSALFEKKTETTTKNLTVILEPVLLIIVWLGVVAVALAVILPIYSLIGNFRP
ncbi:MAG: hypothetical protein COU30_00265 [Candidatus Magasanikbacteria bacterium CG10_big_fil_rev_8_21_14_0_10_38_6]|uniref:Type II secretion system protein GspF domain-containing protein n=1 Tax=Candidatus Magasanikbacteria bacterium CG10_big_fil_rev_8_21_14_0_10_38_6 TaxID=1974647 RepID=A0A2M6P291_9BACT|nr:MAG: hypothetical protein COU30_00265 [Candidatus Magasanikbacteria bacterium CG10_big_fil_rev_8_21_14_0_10_38_6]